MIPTMLDYWVKRYQEHGQWTVGPYNSPILTQQQKYLFGGMLEGVLAEKHFKRCLDFGCGVGRFSEYLKQHADEYVGYDPISQAIEMAAPREGVRFTTELPPEDFDLFVAITVFQHMPDQDLEEALTWLEGKCFEGQVLLIENNMAFDAAAHVFVRSAKSFQERLKLKQGQVMVAPDLSHYMLWGSVV